LFGFWWVDGELMIVVFSYMLGLFVVLGLLLWVVDVGVLEVMWVVELVGVV